MRPRSRPASRRRPTASVMVAALLLATGAAPVRADAAEPAAFLAGLGDVPLMSGLTEAAGASMVFDKPVGRIVEAYAEGAVARADVMAFYRRTLPQLGWRPRPGGGFSREGERLGLVFLGGDGDLIVHFTLGPE